MKNYVASIVRQVKAFVKQHCKKRILQYNKMSE